LFGSVIVPLLGFAEVAITSPWLVVVLREMMMVASGNAARTCAAASQRLVRELSPEEIRAGPCRGGSYRLTRQLLTDY
jgi:hypothetical protein